jgi:hypothetical protein
MTRIETLRKKNTWLVKNDREANFFVNDTCPGRLLKGEPSFDFDSWQVSKSGRVTGCRGIMCEQCWNEEVGEQND